MIFLDVHKEYDKAWLEEIMCALNQNRVTGKKTGYDQKKLNIDLRTRMHPRHDRTR